MTPPGSTRSRWRLEVPPGHAVLGADNGGVLADKRLDLRREPRQAVGLHAENDHIERPGILKAADDFRTHFEIALRAEDAQPAFLHRAQMRAPREERDVLTGTGHAGADVPADGTRPCNQKPHGTRDFSRVPH